MLTPKGGEGHTAAKSCIQDRAGPTVSNLCTLHQEHKTFATLPRRTTDLRGGPSRRRGAERPGQHAQWLTDLLTKPVGTWETTPPLSRGRRLAGRPSTKPASRYPVSVAVPRFGRVRIIQAKPGRGHRARRGHRAQSAFRRMTGVGRSSGRSPAGSGGGQFRRCRYPLLISHITLAVEGAPGSRELTSWYCSPSPGWPKPGAIGPASASKGFSTR
jgi:hypothetical protein